MEFIVAKWNYKSRLRNELNRLLVWESILFKLFVDYLTFDWFNGKIFEYGQTEIVMSN